MPFNRKFCQDTCNKLKLFAYNNFNAERNTIKENWIAWCEKNADTINYELTEYKKNGYEGDSNDITKKMFTSVRYYYMKNPKTLHNIKIGNEKHISFCIDGIIIEKEYVSGKNHTKPKNHRFNKNIINCIILNIHTQFNKTGSNLKPQVYYELFVKDNSVLYKNEMIKFTTNYNLPEIEFDKKLKKTFKNQFYKIKKTYR